MLSSAIRTRFFRAHHLDFPRGIVAITRAAKWAYFSTTVDDLLPLLQKILPLEQTRQLTIRRSDQTAALKQTSPAVQPAPDNKLDFL